jgi:hypothetical protein
LAAVNETSAGELGNRSFVSFAEGIRTNLLSLMCCALLGDLDCGLPLEPGRHCGSRILGDGLGVRPKTVLEVRTAGV